MACTTPAATICSRCSWCWAGSAHGYLFMAAEPRQGDTGAVSFDVICSYLPSVLDCRRRNLCAGAQAGKSNLACLY